jgi:hypothetical protein
MNRSILFWGCLVGLFLCSMDISTEVTILSEDQLLSRYGASCIKCRRLVADGTDCSRTTTGNEECWFNFNPCTGHDCGKSCPSVTWWNMPSGNKEIWTWNENCSMPSFCGCIALINIIKGRRNE